MEIFRLDSRFMQFLTKAAQIMWLNLLTLLMSLPVVTAGAAFTAMNYVLLHIVRDTEGNITKSFFASFRENFRHATGIWVGILGAAGLLISGFLSAKNLPAAQADGYRVILLILGILGFAVTLYIFPLLSHFKNTGRETVKNSFVLMILHFGKTFEMLIIWVGIYYFAIKFFERIVPVLLVFGFTLPAVLCLLILNPLFKNLEGEKVEKNL
ncbi:MAG: DUF624 domain-containing protein [Lachnospiraceae bacterium]|nr:DUF624 domain-containing protein [Lachnospiraceae bacterium]